MRSPAGENAARQIIRRWRSSVRFGTKRIAAPSLIITADRSVLQSVEKVRKYQMAIPDSRLVVLQSDAYHLAVAKPDECVSNVVAFIREHA